MVRVDVVVGSTVCSVSSLGKINRMLTVIWTRCRDPRPCHGPRDQDTVKMNDPSGLETCSESILNHRGECLCC